MEDLQIKFEKAALGIMCYINNERKDCDQRWNWHLQDAKRLFEGKGWRKRTRKERRPCTAEVDVLPKERVKRSPPPRRPCTSFFDADDENSNTH